MNIRNTGTGSHERLIGNSFKSNDFYALEYHQLPNKLPYQCLGQQSSDSNLGFCSQPGLPSTEDDCSVYKQQSFWPNDNNSSSSSSLSSSSSGCSSTIMDHFGSPASALVATEVFMGLTPQFDFSKNDDHQPSCNYMNPPQMPKIRLRDLHIPPSYVVQQQQQQQLGNCSFADSSYASQVYNAASLTKGIPSIILPKRRDFCTWKANY